MNPQAEELNAILSTHPSLFSFLSEKGRSIFFPKKGILGQTAEARGKKINATIGSALADDSKQLCLPSLGKLIGIDGDLAFPYAPSYGRKDLREKWQHLIRRKNPSLKGEISLPVVCSGLTHGLSIAGALFADPGDEILLPDLFWGNYRLVFEHAHGAKLKSFPLFSEGRFNVKDLKKELSGAGKKIVLLNFPNNPTGYTPSAEEMRGIVSALKEAAEDKRVIVLLDDAYFGLVYEEGIERESLFSWLADAHENLLAVKIDGATKEDYAWGFRVAFLTYGIKGASPGMYTALEDKTAGMIRGNLSNAPNLSQSLLLESYRSSSYPEEKEEAFLLLRKRYEKVKDILSEGKFSERFEALPFNSGYFMCVRLKTGDAEEVRRKLLERYDTGVISLPGNLLRVCFAAVRENDIPKLFENIFSACGE